jgi:hypothetical protein
MDTTQAVLVSVIIILTALLVFIGAQVIQILKELKITVEKINKILDDTNIISASVSKPISMVSEALTNSSIVTSLVSAILRSKRKEEKE